jgi:predicted flap endonuclease-1-like 5' DNA nuclease
VFCDKYGRELVSESLSKPIKEIEGIGLNYAEKLKNIGIDTVQNLLDKGCTRTGRKELAEKTGISDKLILEWVSMADLFRIEGIGEGYSDLLEEAGVDTVVELSKRIPESLHTKLKEVNELKKLVKQLPSLDMVKKWIEAAKKLPRKVEY